MVQVSEVLREVKATRYFIPESEVARIKAEKNDELRRQQGYYAEQGIKTGIREGRL